MDTPYEGGVFRCTLKLDSDFPRTPPKGYFLTKIFHPNVSANGDICVNTLKKDWEPAKWSLGHILGVIRCLLIIPFPESSLNEEAGRLFMDDYQEYARMAKLMTKIHAAQAKKAQAEREVNENENSFANDHGEQRMEDEELKDETNSSSIKFHFRNISNLDTSMEEEKDSTQAFGKASKLAFNNQITSWNKQSISNALGDSDNEEQNQNK